jgi:hypothetical protein
VKPNKELEKLTMVSIGGRRYVALDEVLALLAETKQPELPEPPAVPKRAEKDAKASE